MERSEDLDQGGEETRKGGEVGDLQGVRAEGLESRRESVFLLGNKKEAERGRAAGSRTDEDEGLLGVTSPEARVLLPDEPGVPVQRGGSAVVGQRDPPRVGVPFSCSCGV